MFYFNLQEARTIAAALYQWRSSGGILGCGDVAAEIATNDSREDPMSDEAVMSLYERINIGQFKALTDAQLHGQVTIHALTLHDAHDSETFPCLTEAGARSLLAEHVEEDWDDMIDSVDPFEEPKDPDTRIEVYFEKCSWKSYSIHTIDLNP